jgi:hypothetical protein
MKKDNDETPTLSTSGKEMYSAEEFAHAIGSSTRSIQEHIRRGSIASQFIGIKRLIPREEIQRIKDEGLKPLPAPKKTQKRK